MYAPAKFQRQLLDQAQQIYHATPISDATAEAFLATPRHLFVRRYRERASKEWCEVNQENLDQHPCSNASARQSRWRRRLESRVPADPSDERRAIKTLLRPEGD